MLSSLRKNLALCSCLIGMFVIPLIASVAVLVEPNVAGAQTTPPTSACSSQSTTAKLSTFTSYYLFESNGVVVSCGGAPLHGWERHASSTNPIVTGSATTAGGGYWLVSALGNVYKFGDAQFFGSPAKLHLRSTIVGFAPTADDAGYWLVTATGSLFHYGDAGFYGSTVRDHTDGTVVAILPTPDSKGYWIVYSDGAVHNFGDAAPLGSLAHHRPVVVAATATPDGRGLLLLTKDGGVHNLGTSVYYGSLVHQHLSRPLTAIVSGAEGFGYLIASASGNIFNYGASAFEGSIAASPPRRPARVVAIGEVTFANALLTSASVIPGNLLPQGAFGYDISNYQCTAPGSSVASTSLPPASPFSVIEAAGWLNGANNSCLSAEAAWAATAAGPGGAHYSLYLFMNSPDQSSGASALDANGPAGQCASLAASAQSACIAYNYGYEGASAAYSYAASIGVSSQLWWLDVEGTNLSKNQWSNYSQGIFWSSSTTLNAATIQGAIDALRAAGTTVGIYSTSVQFPTIAGPFVPTGAQIPIWVAGVPYTNPPYTQSGLPSPSVLAGWCAGTSGYSGQASTDIFAGGVPWILQETPGAATSPYGIDPDYAC